MISYAALSQQDLEKEVSELSEYSQKETQLQKMEIDSPQFLIQEIKNLPNGSKTALNRNFQDIQENLMISSSKVSEFRELSVLIRFRILALYCVNISSNQISDQHIADQSTGPFLELFRILLDHDVAKSALKSGINILKSLFGTKKNVLSKEDIHMELSLTRRLIYKITGTMVRVVDSKGHSVSLTVKYEPKIFLSVKNQIVSFMAPRNGIVDKICYVETDGPYNSPDIVYKLVVSNLHDSSVVSTMDLPKQSSGVAELSEHFVILFTPNSTIEVYDINTLQLIKTLYMNDNGNVSVLQLQKDNNTLFCGTDNAHVVVFDLITLTESWVLKTEMYLIISLATVGDLLYVGCNSGIIGLVDLTSHAFLRTICQSSFSVFGLVASPDNTRLFSYTTENIIKVWDTTTHTRVHSIEKLSKATGKVKEAFPITQLMLLNEHVLCGICSYDVVFWNVHTYAEVHRFTLHTTGTASGKNGSLSNVNSCPIAFVVNKSLYITLIVNEIVVYDYAMLAEMLDGKM